MYVCICQSIKEKDLHQAYHEGRQSIEKLLQVLGLGTGCGMCADFARQLLQKEQEKNGDSQQSA